MTWNRSEIFRSSMLKIVEIKDTKTETQVCLLNESKQLSFLVSYFQLGQSCFSSQFLVWYVFGCQRKTVLITHPCFSCCCTVMHGAKDASVSQLLVPTCQWGAWGAQEVGGAGDRTRTADLKWTNGHSMLIFHTIWHNVRKLQNWGQLAMGWGMGHCCCLGSGQALVTGW